MNVPGEDGNYEAEPTLKSNYDEGEPGIRATSGVSAVC